ncbi:hypothetical protein KQX54_010868 [Cotesia glomerata]|uniref:Uncharacterized protein n=1 Tax=Cotesia glomerata TaxID=32391 RepID=A0AAV7J7A9_COTGL|nr:hypothetical protein KQX54_010868 [Cotesia glomerata]
MSTGGTHWQVMCVSDNRVIKETSRSWSGAVYSSSGEITKPVLADMTSEICTNSYPSRVPIAGLILWQLLPDLQYPHSTHTHTQVLIYSSTDRPSSPLCIRIIGLVSGASSIFCAAIPLFPQPTGLDVPISL